MRELGEIVKETRKDRRIGNNFLPQEKSVKWARRIDYSAQGEAEMGKGHKDALKIGKNITLPKRGRAKKHSAASQKRTEKGGT